MRKSFILPLIGCLGLLMACSNAEEKDNNTTKEETPVAGTDENNKDADTLLAYKHVRAVYNDFEFGDLPHYGFKTEAGEYLDFSMIKDLTMREELISFDEETGMETANPKYKGKMFDIYYKIEQHDLMDFGQAMDVEVAYLVKLVE